MKRKRKRRKAAGGGELHAARELERNRRRIDAGQTRSLKPSTWRRR